MALNASSNNDYIVGLYAVAAVLAGMVVLAGIFIDHRQHQQQCSAAYQLLWNAALSWGRKKSGSDACPAGSPFLV